MRVGDGIMKNKIFLKILLIILILVLILFTIYVFKNKQKKGGEFIPNNLEEMFSVNSITDITIDDKKYIKVGLTIDNETNTDIELSKYILELYNENKETISLCYSKAYYETL